MDTIISKTNDKVKFIKSLNDKKNRQKYNSFYLEGIKVVDEVLNNKEAIDILFIASCDAILNSLNGGQELIDKINNEKTIEKINLDEKVFEYVTDTVTPQGILVVIKIPEYNLEEILKNTKTNIMILDRVQDNGNLGTIIRTADAFGVKTILCLKGTVDAFSPKVVRATMGSILRVNIVYIEESDLLVLKNNNYKIIGTDLNAKTDFKSIDYSKKIAFVLGNEAKGVSDNINKLCDENIKIEMENTAESLNVGIAAGIILYEQYKK